jgi:hypothetical protein
MLATATCPWRRPLQPPSRPGNITFKQLCKLKRVCLGSGQLEKSGGSNAGNGAQPGQSNLFYFYFINEVTK